MLKVLSVFRRPLWRQIVLCAVFAVFVSAGASNIYSQKSSGESPPSLRGKEAVTRLKENGQYDSLMEAVENARQKSVKTDEADAPESAVGQTAKLIAGDGATGDELGFSVAVSGETAIVSAYKDNAPNTDQGSVYVFVRNGTVWTQQQQLTASDGAANDQFGNSVAIAGSNIIVGANRDNINANDDQGAAYNFRVLNPNWMLETKTTSDDGLFDDQFGISVGISGETVVIGAIFDDVGANFDQGSAYVFERSGTTWTQKTKLIDNNGISNDFFGSSAAISGDKIVVGSPNNETLPSAELDQGAVLFFVNTPLNPTAANISIAGYVTANGAALRNASVRLTNDSGESLTTQTGSFGRYPFIICRLVKLMLSASCRDAIRLRRRLFPQLKI